MNRNIIRNINRYGLLTDAANWCEIDKAEEFINLGANINIQYLSGDSPLMRATCVECVEIVKLLINAGAIIDLRDRNGYTALIHAAIGEEGETNEMNMNRYIQIAKLLIDAGADINIQDNRGLTALMHACINERAKMVSFLIDEGADISLENRGGQTAFDMASDDVKRLFNERKLLIFSAFDTLPEIKREIGKFLMGKPIYKKKRPLVRKRSKRKQ